MVYIFALSWWIGKKMGIEALKKSGLILSLLSLIIAVFCRTSYNSTSQTASLRAEQVYGIDLYGTDAEYDRALTALTKDLDKMDKLSKTFLVMVFFDIEKYIYIER